MLVVSPFSRGGYVSSEVFDHTSQIRFLEERFGIHADAISAWRRKTVGNLASTLRMGGANTAVPSLPPTSDDTVAAVTQLGCTSLDIDEIAVNQPAYPMAATQVMPTQERGTVNRLPAQTV
jgi:phospholipase C